MNTCLANFSEMARPIPEEAPVTKAHLALYLTFYNSVVNIKKEGIKKMGIPLSFVPLTKRCE